MCLLCISWYVTALKLTITQSIILSIYITTHTLLSTLSCLLSSYDAVLTLCILCCKYRSLWVVSRYDFAVWILTFLSTSIISVTAGLVLGIAFSVLVTLIQIQRMGGHALKQAGDTEIYLHTDDKRSTIGQIFVFR